MGKRVVCYWLLSLCAGCAVVSPPTGEPAKPQAAVEPAKPQAGETADPLKLAAECLERGDDAAALPHLAQYVAAHPDHAAIRAHLAEVELRQGRRAGARREFEQYLADAEERGETKHLIHVHTRLVEIATADGDEYGERLHRGIGLFRLAKQVQAKPEDDGPEPEKLLFKAAAEFKSAARLRPDEARVHWYAYEVWTHLGQTLPARTSLRRARDCAALSDLTPVEREGLSAACETEFGAR
jgi:hypothetical protein